MRRIVLSLGIGLAAPACVGFGANEGDGTAAAAWAAEHAGKESFLTSSAAPAQSGHPSQPRRRAPPCAQITQRLCEIR